jgi:hypothetical protein
VSVRPQIQALKLRVAHRVITRQIVHAFLSEHQEAIKVSRPHGVDRITLTRGKFFSGEMQHQTQPPEMADDPAASVIDQILQAQANRELDT